MPDGQDFSSQLANIIAPYRQMAQPFMSPYMTMQPTGYLPQQHPGIARILDASVLAAGMTPGPQGPEGVGGGISRFGQGQIGAMQQRREQMLRGAMLPYQMAMTQLQAGDVLSQMRLREQEAPYYMKRGEWMEKRADMMDQPRFVPGGIKTDDTGQNWHEIFDPTTGRVRNFNPSTQQYADELSPEKQPAFTRLERSQRMSQPGGLGGEVFAAIMSKDPNAQRMLEAYRQVTGAQAGAAAGGRQAVTEPAKDLDSFVREQERIGNVDKPVPTFDQWLDAPSSGYKFYSSVGLLSPQEMAKAKAEYAGFAAPLQRDKEMFAQYEDDIRNNRVPRMGYQEYKNFLASGGRPAGYTPAPATPAAAPSPAPSSGPSMGNVVGSWDQARRKYPSPQ